MGESILATARDGCDFGSNPPASFDPDLQVVAMGDYGSIADVGQTLVDLLEDRMEGLIGRDDVALASPESQGEGGNNWRLTLYLYDISENEHQRNADRQDPEPSEPAVSGSPLVLDLQYLLTAHPSKGGTAGTNKTKEQHRVLGRAMQVFRDNAIVRGPDLKGSLADEENLHLSIEQESLDAVMDIWNTFPDQPYQPSVAYLVTPVTIESREETPVQRILERDMEQRELASEVEGE